MIQNEWRWCNRCEGLFFAHAERRGVCPHPVGGPHVIGGGDYYLPLDEPQYTGQPNWRWCCKCEGLFFFGHQNHGVCPADHQQHAIGGGNYTLVLKNPTVAGQQEWRWCNKCEGLFYGGDGRQGHCPAGGTHLVGGGNYTLALDHPPAPPVPPTAPPQVVQYCVTIISFVSGGIIHRETVTGNGTFDALKNVRKVCSAWGASPSGDGGFNFADIRSGPC